MSGDGTGGVHQDCNGKTPLSQLLQPPPLHQTEQTGGTNNQSQLIANVFPQVNTRSKDPEDLDDDIEYVSDCSGKKSHVMNRYPIIHSPIPGM